MENTLTDEEKTALSCYVESIRAGHTRATSRQNHAVTAALVRRAKLADPCGFGVELREAELDALRDKQDAVERKLYDMAVAGDLYAIRMWLQARAPRRWARESGPSSVTQTAIRVGVFPEEVRDAVAEIVKAYLTAAGEARRVGADGNGLDVDRLAAPDAPEP